jgi:hypothetical protein
MVWCCAGGCVCLYLQADDWLKPPCWMLWDKEVWWVNERWVWESSCPQDFEQGDIDDGEEGKKKNLLIHPCTKSWGAPAAPGNLNVETSH